MSVIFYKYHALGNDYIVIDPNKSQIDLTEDRIKLICHRNFGVGSDGILLGPIFNGEKIALRIFNPDGSEAEKSGNGIRIFSRYLLDAEYIKEKSFYLDTLGGQVKVEYLDDVGRLIKVDMGKPTFQSDLLPMVGSVREVIDELLNLGEVEYRATCLSVGNPHCVIILPEISSELAKKIGPLVENHTAFPNRINMQIVKIIDRNNIQIEIWERGAGYTLASGSSSSAAASASYKLGLVNNLVKVHMPGGTIDIEIGPDGRIHMTGTVCSVAVGEISSEITE